MSAAHKAQSPVAAGQSAEKNTFEIGSLPYEEQFYTIAARFALAGHALQCHTRADDGRITYTVSRWDQSRAFSHWHDVLAFLVQVGGAAT